MWARQCPKEDGEKSAGLYTMGKGPRIWPPDIMINWDCFPPSPPPPPPPATYFFSFKHCHGQAESLDLVSGHTSTISPSCWLFWIKYFSSLPKHVFQFTGWRVSNQTCAGLQVLWVLISILKSLQSTKEMSWSKRHLRLHPFCCIFLRALLRDKTSLAG